VKDKFSPGDLVRMCTHAEADSVHRGYVDWCYGIYVGREEDNEAAEYGWIPRSNNLILCESRIQSFDHYWHIERVS
jgi:hypothetical protein